MNKKPAKKIRTLPEIATALGVLLSIVSIVSIGWHCYHFFQGPESAMLPVSQILFYAKEYPDGHAYLHVAARLSYINKGAPGYNDAIYKEFVTMRLEGTAYLLKWENFVDISIMKERWDMNPLENAHPVTIEAGGSVSHMTSFIPQPCNRLDLPSDLKKNDAFKETYCSGEWHNYLKWSDFCKILKKTEKVILVFRAETVDGETLMKECAVKIAPGDINEETEQRNLIVRSCCDEKA